MNSLWTTDSKHHAMHELRNWYEEQWKLLMFWTIFAAWHQADDERGPKK